jgi:hypothetical protein
VRASRFVVKAVHPLDSPPRDYGPGHRVELHVLEINLFPLSRFYGSSRAHGLVIVLCCMCGDSARKLQNVVRITRLYGTVVKT